MDLDGLGINESINRTDEWMSIARFLMGTKHGLAKVSEQGLLEDSVHELLLASKRSLLSCKTGVNVGSRTSATPWARA